MKTYHNIHTTAEPEEIEFTNTSVLVASNIHPYATTIDGYEMSGYEYDCTEYTKDEYLAAQNAKVAQLEQQLAAAKILLGVD